MYTSRYVRTKDARRRRLSLGHLEAQRMARRMASDILTARDLIDAWHISGPFGQRPAGVGRARRCVYARRRQRQDAAWAAWRLQVEADNQTWARTRRVVEYFRLQPFANGSEYDHWSVRNCERCARYEGCPLRDAIEWAACTDGMLDNGVAGRIWRGLPEGPCAEREVER